MEGPYAPTESWRLTATGGQGHYLLAPAWRRCVLLLHEDGRVRGVREFASVERAVRAADRLAQRLTCCGWWPTVVH